MPRKSVYDLAALAVAAGLVLMMLGVGVRMLTYRPELPPEVDTAPAPELTSEEREALRDADGIVWSTPRIDWAALYPPQETADDTAEETAAGRFAAWVEDLHESTRPYEERVDALEAWIDDYATDYAPGYHTMVETANRYDAILGWEIAGVQSYNPVIMAEDNYFITCVARQDREQRAAEITALRDFCVSHGMAHLYVTTPNDTCRYDEGISGVMDFYNQNADRLQKALREAGVDTMDLRDDLHAAGMDHHASFYQTDHHWRPETGRWAAGQIARRLNEDYGFSFDLSLYEPERWRAELYEDWFLGSQGKKVTLARATPEDFTLLYPEFDTCFRIEIPSFDLDKTGDFSVFYRYGAVNTRDYYTQSPYAAYFYGDNALTRVHNELRADGKRVLVLGHSFDNCVLPFLALGTEYLDSIDPREFTGSIETFLTENHYDIVIELFTE